MHGKRYMKGNTRMQYRCRAGRRLTIKPIKGSPERSVRGGAESDRAFVYVVANSDGEAAVGGAKKASISNKKKKIHKCKQTRRACWKTRRKKKGKPQSHQSSLADPSCCHGGGRGRGGGCRGKQPMACDFLRVISME